MNSDEDDNPIGRILKGFFEKKRKHDELLEKVSEEAERKVLMEIWRSAEQDTPTYWTSFNLIAEITKCIKILRDGAMESNSPKQFYLHMIKLIESEIQAIEKLDAFIESEEDNEN